jgi:hypothetical protein
MEHCKTCRLWDKATKDCLSNGLRYGTEEEIDDEPDILIHFDFEGIRFGVGLKTGPDFGCVHHQPILVEE